MLAWAAGVFAGLLGLWSVPALASAAGSEPVLCPGQVFSQPFAAQGDTNFYTLVPGGEFNSPAEGWQLYNGARVLPSSRPNGSAGGVLDMPSGALAVSPPVCVTLRYPSARVWVRDVKGSLGLAAAVAYAGSRFTITSPQSVGQLHGQQASWTLSEPIDVQPLLGAGSEGPREARFVFLALGKASEYQLSGLWVDPRMS